MLVLKPGRECLTGKLWLKRSTMPKRSGSSSCQTFMNSSLIRLCSGVIGGSTLGHLAVCMGKLLAPEALGAFHDEAGPRPNLLVDAADVLAEDPDADQLDAAEERDKDDEGRVAPKDGPAHELVEKVDRHQQEREAGDDETEHRAEREGVGREAEDPVEADPKRPEEAVVVRLPGEARRPLEGEEVLPEADHGHHAPQEAVALLEPH